MRTALNVFLYIVAIALVFVNLFVFNDRLEQAKQEAYSEGYAAAQQELESDIEHARITGFAEGYEKGRKEGFDGGMNTALSDSLMGEHYRNEYYDDDYRALEDMIQDEVYERTQRIMEENEALRDILDEYDIGYDY